MDVIRQRVLLYSTGVRKAERSRNQLMEPTRYADGLLTVSINPVNPVKCCQHLSLTVNCQLVLGHVARYLQSSQSFCIIEGPPFTSKACDCDKRFHPHDRCKLYDGLLPRYP
jgi:hypothetical protein